MSSPVFETSRLEPSSTPVGQVYSLPRVYLPITVERKVELVADPGGSENKLERRTTTLSTGPNPLIVADSENTFVLKYDRDWTSTTDFTVVTDARGLLTSVSSTTTDAIPEIVKNASSALEEFAGFAPEVAGTSPSGQFKITALVDMTNPERESSGWNDLQRMLEVYDVDINASFQYRIDYQQAQEQEQEQATASRNNLCGHHICFRSAETHTITIHDLHGFIQAELLPPDESPTHKVVSTVVVLPTGPVAGISVDRHALVTNTFDIKFADGLLTQVKVSDPSSASGAASSMIDGIKAVASIPSAILGFTIRSDTTNQRLAQEQAELNAQKEVLEARLALVEAREKLLEADRDDSQD